MVDSTGGDHQAWVEGTASDAAEGMPCSCSDLVLTNATVEAGERMPIRSSNQSQKSAKPCWTRYLVALKLNQGSTVQWLSGCSLLIVHRCDWLRGDDSIDRHTLVDDALEADDGEQSASNGGGGNGAQDDQTQQASSVAGRLSLEEEVGAAGGRTVGGHGGSGSRGYLAEGGR